MALGTVNLRALMTGMITKMTRRMGIVIGIVRMRKQGGIIPRF